MENRMQQNLGKELGDKKLFYSQRQFDALIIARYQKGSLGSEVQGLILNKESNADIWKKSFAKNRSRRKENHMGDRYDYVWKWSLLGRWSRLYTFRRDWYRGLDR